MIANFDKSLFLFQSQKDTNKSGAKNDLKLIFLQFFVYTLTLFDQKQVLVKIVKKNDDFQKIKSEAAFRLGQNRKSFLFFDQNIDHNNDVIYGHCLDGQKFHIAKKGQKRTYFSVF